jgi:hypothetical protein
MSTALTAGSVIQSGVEDFHVLLLKIMDRHLLYEKQNSCWLSQVAESDRTIKIGRAAAEAKGEISLLESAVTH